MQFKDWAKNCNFVIRDDSHTIDIQLDIATQAGTDWPGSYKGCLDKQPIMHPILEVP